jgi:Uncharacterized protein conserved in bacteria (DUF2252).
LNNKTAVEELFQAYVNNFSEERRHLMSSFRVSSRALRVVGLGSVGTHCIILLLEGLKKMRHLLQLKEAGPSVLEPYVAKRKYAGHAQRVVNGQKLIQAASDIFLEGIEDPLRGIQYYWR